MANRFWVGGTGTWDASDTTHWAVTTGGAGGQTVPGSADLVIFDANSGGGTTTVNTNPTIQSLTLTNYTGTLDFAANDNNITITSTSGFTDTAGTHTLNMGDGTWTFSAVSGTLWNAANAGLTFNCNASTIVFSGASTTGISFRGGGKTYNSISLTGSGRFAMNSSAASMATLSVVAGNQMYLGGGFTFTIATAPTLTGTRAAPIVFVSDSSTVTAAFAITSGTFALDWGILSGITASGGTAFTATHSVAYGTNTGWTISSGPSAGGAGVIGS